VQSLSASGGGGPGGTNNPGGGVASALLTGQRIVNGLTDVAYPLIRSYIR
ncbi:unnamed protein product, partial [marine sediment metagenome]